ncbi:hypothetical protein [Paenibacillus wynnii]|uniref:hypothetical protein n=1 Tax=Paenibacillus wynnii TaxID=268407 RepID=UPI002793339A|nr:hypothetical protein [Paenibacillus wynnii]MDQ0196301.1 hypothetical protein [Paenibacillus wynnii]
MLMTKRKIGIIVSLAAILTLSITYIIADQTIKKEISTEAEHIIFANADEAIRASDIAIEATVLDGVKNVVEYQDGYPSGFTLRDIKVNKVLDGNKEVKKEQLAIAEPYYEVGNGVAPGTTVISYEEYTPLQPGSKYVLFLKWSDKIQAYWVNSLEQGKVNIDKKDIKELSNTKNDNQMQKLSESVLEKYGYK